MIIISIKTDELIPYARNSRTHDAKQVSQIASSIKEFGFNNPVLIDGDNGTNVSTAKNDRTSRKSSVRAMARSKIWQNHYINPQTKTAKRLSN